MFKKNLKVGIKT